MIVLTLQQTDGDEFNFEVPDNVEPGTYVWPDADGNSGDVLVTDGAGALSWESRSTLAIEDVFPVGSVYVEKNGTNPNTLLGFGTWSEVVQSSIAVHFWERTA